MSWRRIEWSCASVGWVRGWFIELNRTSSVGYIWFLLTSTVVCWVACRLVKVFRARLVRRGGMCTSRYIQSGSLAKRSDNNFGLVAHNQATSPPSTRISLQSSQEQTEHPFSAAAISASTVTSTYPLRPPRPQPLSAAVEFHGPHSQAEPSTDKRKSIKWLLTMIP